MQRSPRNVRLSFNHAGLTHYGGAFFLHEFCRLLRIRNFLALHLSWYRRNSNYSLSQMVLALVWPLVLGLDRIETASLLGSNGTFQYLTGLPSFPHPQTLRRFLLSAPLSFVQQLQRVNDRLLQLLVHVPSHRSRFILDLDSTVITAFGQQEGATVGYNPRYRGKRSYQPLLCLESTSAHLCGTRLRPGKTDPHSGTVELFRECWSNLPLGLREVRLRADAGFYDGAFFEELDNHDIEYAVVAKIYPPLKRLLPGISYHHINPVWEMGECEYQAHTWSEARRHVVARRLVATDSPSTLFTLGRYQYRCWVTSMNLTAPGVQRFYDGRATIELRIRELRQDFALGNIPTRQFAANALYLEIIRFAYNLVTAFQRICLPENWHSFTLQTLRHKLFLLPGHLSRPQNRPVLRLNSAPKIESLARYILEQLEHLKPLT